MTLPSAPKSISRVESFLHKVNATAGLDDIAFHKVMVSLTEAVNNAIMHGNRAQKEKKVHVRCEVEEDGLLFCVADEGRGFRPELIDSPLKDENLLKESGRGVFLMRTLMDRVDFHRAEKGMEVCLWLGRRR
jgi:serine/threonine-protein kinase RsbW